MLHGWFRSYWSVCQRWEEVASHVVHTRWKNTKSKVPHLLWILVKLAWNIMPGVLTNIATVYPNVQSQDMDDVTFKPLFFTIRFSGTLPKHLIEQNIVSVINCLWQFATFIYSLSRYQCQLLKNNRCITMPFVKAISSMDQWQSDTESMLNSSDSNVSIFGCIWLDETYIVQVFWYHWMYSPSWWNPHPIPPPSINIQPH
jgi:hypothetical protein